MSKSPLLTICVLTHNSEKFLRKTLQSILDQTYQNFEIIVSDNYSSDNTEKIVKSFQSPKIFFRKNILTIESDQDYIGGYDNYNGCIKSGLIKGEFVAFCHSDDIYEKNIAEEEIKFLRTNPEAGAVFTSGKMIDIQDKIIGEFNLPRELRAKNIYNFMEIFNAILNNGNIFLWTPTFMVKREVFEKIRLFDEKKFRTSADLEMWLKILKKYKIGILNKKFIKRRMGSGGGKKYQYLCTERSDFFKVMDYYLNSKLKTQKIQKKFLRQYEYQKRVNDTIRAMNFLIKNQKGKATSLISKKLSFNLFIAFFENLNSKKIKSALLRTALIIGINLGLGKPLGKLLYRIRYN